MTDYISNINDIPIGGKQFDGEWELSQVALASAGTLAAGASATYDISSYIPNDGYDYECLFSYYAETNGTAGDILQLRFGQGTSANAAKIIADRMNPTGGIIKDGKQIILPILASGERKVTVLNCRSTATGVFRIFLNAKRRLGNNFSLTNPIKTITTPNDSIDVGGDNTNDGEWVAIQTALLRNVTVAPGASHTLDLSNILPNDGYDYECLFRTWGETGAKSGNWTEFQIGNGNISSYIVRAQTRTASSVRFGGNAIMPITTNRQVILSNYSGTSGTASSVYFQILGYKRLIKPATGNYISNINGNPFGGDNFSGRWTNTRISIISNASYSDTATTTRTYTVDNYLPDNVNQYEILFGLTSATPATSNRHTNISLKCDYTGQLLGAYNSTRENRRARDAQLGILVGKQVNNTLTITITNAANSYADGISLLLYGYRKVGTAGNI